MAKKEASSPQVENISPRMADGISLFPFVILHVSAEANFVHFLHRRITSHFDSCRNLLSGCVSGSNAWKVLYLIHANY